MPLPPPLLTPPYSRRSIPGSRDDRLTVPAERDVGQWLIVASKRGDGAAVRERPNLGGAVERACGDEAVVRTEGGSRDLALMPGKTGEFAAVGSPNSCRVAVQGGQHELPIGAEQSFSHIPVGV